MRPFPSAAMRAATAAMIGSAMIAGCAASPDPSTLGRLSWMVGCWRSADGINTQVWSAPAGSVMFGHAVTMNGDQLSFFEQSRIDLRAPKAAYTSSPDGLRPITFTEPAPPAATDQASLSVRFENAAHSYPQAITYRSLGRAGLAATVSMLDGSRPVDYVWERCKS
ncbi:MAG: hypothetical protein KGS00_00370 [Alphaproteobacteria bacterium]|nr:hypothetical protein [Alphaproteobacteria bacterium]